MKQKYQTPQLELMWIDVDVITASTEEGDNVGGLPSSSWTPGP